MSPQPTTPVSAFLERLVALLLPYFVTPASDRKTARTEILEILESYGTRTRAEMLNAARIMAMTFTSLELLSEATSNQITFPTRLRTCSLGNSLGRSCQQDERALAKRLSCVGQKASSKTAEPINDLTDAQAAASLERTKAKLESYRNRLSGTQPATGKNTDPDQRPWGSKMMQALDNAMQAAPA
jgi:hypothetical protein